METSTYILEKWDDCKGKYHTVFRESEASTVPIISLAHDNCF